MKFSDYFLPTLRENPQDSDTKSHRLMLRSGMIRKLASGTYSYLPFGLKALKKAENIVREEMDAAGALELLLPAIHPADLWKETSRFEIMGEDMIRFKDRHGRLNVLGPTHEEIITDLIRREVSTYRQLPILLYQIQTKFRDEMRPRAGVVRSREFIMKDAYSFHTSQESLDEMYERMSDVYSRIFERCGLDFFKVQADPGAMGGTGSQEFVLFSEAGEDRVVQFGDTSHVVSAEMASRRLQNVKIPSVDTEAKPPREMHTPNASSIESLCGLLKCKPKAFVKTMIYQKSPQKTSPKDILAVLIRGDHEVSEYKLKKEFPEAVLASPEIIESCKSSFGYSGPFGLDCDRILLDEDVLLMKKWIVGANKPDYHLVGVQPDSIKDLGENRIKVGDYREVVEGDEAEVDNQIVKIKLKTAIELGHIFKLNLRYSEPMKACFKNEKGDSIPILMGCYGIGINRIVAAMIEQSALDDEIRWPSLNSCPFQILILTTHTDNEELNKAAQELYSQLAGKGWDILWDDRDLSAGIKFNDADLMGIPIRITLGPKGLKEGKYEVKHLNSKKSSNVPLDQIISQIQKYTSS